MILPTLDMLIEEATSYWYEERRRGAEKRNQPRGHLCEI
jgi:hypothetical protein